nr:unnamed protein product [Callosobruchus analis]
MDLEQTTPLFYHDNPEASFSNGSRLNLENLNLDSLDSNFAILLCSLVFAVGWVIYITYYNSRVVAYIITQIVNKLFINDGFFKIVKTCFRIAVFCGVCVACSPGQIL